MPVHDQMLSAARPTTLQMNNGNNVTTNNIGNVLTNDTNNGINVNVGQTNIFHGTGLNGAQRPNGIVLATNSAASNGGVRVGVGSAQQPSSNGGATSTGNANSMGLGNGTLAGNSLSNSLGERGYSIIDIYTMSVSQKNSAIICMSYGAH